MGYKSPLNMFPADRWRQRFFIGGGGKLSYIDKVLGYNPYAYWPFWEAAGLTAECLVNSPAQDGTYTGVTLGQPGIGDGNTAPYFDGINDRCNIYSVPLAGVFDGDEGTFACWIHPNAQWGTAVIDVVVYLQEDGANRNRIYFSAVNTLVYKRTGSGFDAQVNRDTTLDSLAWHHLAMTWSLSAGVDGEYKAYFDGAQTGATQTTIGAHVGTLDIDHAMVGAFDTAGTSAIESYLAHPALWNSALPLATIADLATV